jgi:hypothetical protein
VLAVVIAAVLIMLVVGLLLSANNHEQPRGAPLTNVTAKH